MHKTQYSKRRNHETVEKTRPVNDIQYNETIRSQVMQLMNSSQLKTIIEKTSVYHTVNGNCTLFHTSKTAKMIKVILLRAPCQNVNVLLSNITFIIFAVFDV